MKTKSTANWLRLHRICEKDFLKALLTTASTYCAYLLPLIQNYFFMHSPTTTLNIVCAISFLYNFQKVEKKTQRVIVIILLQPLHLAPRFCFSALACRRESLGNAAPNSTFCALTNRRISYWWKALSKQTKMSHRKTRV